jgi:single-strand DNA-binding protein
MNVVTLIGNLATEVELREVGPDKKVASFVLAVDRASRDGGADFVRVSAWDRQAELCAEYLGKGRRIAVDGRLKSRSWEDEGKRRSALEVVARRVEFLGGGPRPDQEERRGSDPVRGARCGLARQRVDELVDRSEAGVRPLADQEVAATGDHP